MVEVCSKTELCNGNGADTQLGRFMSEDRLRYAPSTAQRETYGVGVEYEQSAHAKGSRFFAMFRDFGRSISSPQAPRTARNSADHSSAGSRITFFPTRFTETSFSPSGKRHDLGSRTA